MPEHEMDAWANFLRFKYGLSAPIDPAMVGEPMQEDGALYGEGDLYGHDDDPIN